jgi:hypothetical protein
VQVLGCPKCALKRGDGDDREKGRLVLREIVRGLKVKLVTIRSSQKVDYRSGIKGFGSVRRMVERKPINATTVK